MEAHQAPPSLGFSRQEHWSDFPFTVHFHALEKEMATHSSVLAWRVPGTGEPGGLPSYGVAQSRTRLKRLSSSSSSSSICLTLCDPIRWQPTRLPHPWDSPGKNIGVGCHFLLQCMKVKSESEVAQSCPTLSDPTDCSPPGYSVYGIFQARVLEWGQSG